MFVNREPTSRKYDLQLRGKGHLLWSNPLSIPMETGVTSHDRPENELGAIASNFRVLFHSFDSDLKMLENIFFMAAIS